MANRKLECVRMVPVPRDVLAQLREALREIERKVHENSKDTNKSRPHKIVKAARIS